MVGGGTVLGMAQQKQSSLGIRARIAKQKLLVPAATGEKGGLIDLLSLVALLISLHSPPCQNR